MSTNITILMLGCYYYVFIYLYLSSGCPHRVLCVKNQHFFSPSPNPHHPPTPLQRPPNTLPTPLRPPPSPTILSEPITTILYLFVLGEKIKNAQNHHASEMPRKVTFNPLLALAQPFYNQLTSPLDMWFILTLLII